MRINSLTSVASNNNSGVKNSTICKGKCKTPKKSVELSSQATAAASQIGLILGCLGAIPLGAKIKDISPAKTYAYALFVLCTSIAFSFGAIGVAKAIKGSVVSMNESADMDYYG